MELTAERCPRVFVSHNSADKPLSRRVARRLHHAGAEVILDEVDLEPGQPLTESLRQEIDRSTHLVVIWTATAAASEWVRREIEFARSKPAGPVVIPLLFIPAGQDSIVSDCLGVNFPHAHRFERSFEGLLKVIFRDNWMEPAPKQLAIDLLNTLSETPVIGHLFSNQVEDQYVAMKEALDDDKEDRMSDHTLRDKVLPVLQSVFDVWRKPESVSVIGLPQAGDADYHALDFAMWCAVHIVLAQPAELAGPMPIELSRYPGIFAKVFGTTLAGYEALAALFTKYPGLAADAMSELINPESVSAMAMPAVVELFETAFALCRNDTAKDQITPYSAAWYFLRRNCDRLSPDQKNVFFRLVEAHEQGPYPGGPLDILAALLMDPRFTLPVVQRVQFWVENGLFDHVDPQRRSDSPALFYGFVANMLKGRLKESAERLLTAARVRIKKLLRSTHPENLVFALHWIADADRLPLSERTMVGQAYEEGVFSTEFENTDYGDAVRPLIASIVRSVTQQQHTSENLRQNIEKLQRHIRDFK